MTPPMLPVNRPRNVGWALIIVAWLLLLVSLPMPGLTDLGVPVWAIMAITVGALVGPEGVIPSDLVLIGFLSFLACTILFFWRPRTIPGILMRVPAIAGLLGIWMFPIAGAIYDGVGVRAWYVGLRWGYYLFAAAHTLVLIASITALMSREHAAERAPGFPVVAPDEKVGPPQSS